MSDKTNKTVKRRPKKPTAPKDWRVAFLAELAKTGVVSVAYNKAKVSKATVYAKRAEDSAFAEAWDEAKDMALDAIEASFHKRAVRPGDGASHVIGMFLLKSLRRVRFGETKADIHIHNKAAESRPRLSIPGSDDRHDGGPEGGQG